jgi:hypothetical protein
MRRTRNHVRTGSQLQLEGRLASEILVDEDLRSGGVGADAEHGQERGQLDLDGDQTATDGAEVRREG